MGYTTDFSGQLEFSKPLTASQVKYINAFQSTRRMKRDAIKAESFPDELRLAVGLPIGSEGAYYVGSHNDGNCGQTQDASIIDYNSNGKMPSLWCRWEVSEDGTNLQWDGGEKFYCYVEWLQYLITHFFDVWGVKLNGKIEWFGEDSDDTGTITVNNSQISKATKEEVLTDLQKENEELKARCETYKKDYDSMVKEVLRLSGQKSELLEALNMAVPFLNIVTYSNQKGYEKLMYKIHEATTKANK